MNIRTINYLEAAQGLPQEGQHILAQQERDSLVIYQAYNSAIADYALRRQLFGGPHYSYNRMSWVKPNFLWMMYRCGWASKENQERVLAITIAKATFDEILSEAVVSSFQSAHYHTHGQWRMDLDKKQVRLQWDPDHDPFGKKLARRAVQLGMKGSVLENFGKGKIISIEDITPFVKQQKQKIDNGHLKDLSVPVETVYRPSDNNLCKRLGID